MSSDLRDLVATLHALHDQLAAAVVELSPDQLRTRSYASEWSVADVLSHIGSGAELTLLSLDSGEEDGPSQEERAGVWATWDARTPEQQAVEAVAVDARLVARLEELGDPDLDVLRHDVGGIELDAAGMLRLRVSEHAMHGWDVAVTFDDAAVVAPEAVPALLAVLPVTLRFAARPHDEVLAVDVTLTDPDRSLTLALEHGETRVHERAATDADGGETAVLELPAEAFLRLVYGRLDPRHSPPVKVSDDALLDRLRGIFRGF